jgi:hypothetical protein
MTDFFSWQTLATFAGCTAGTAIIVQFLKNVDFIAKLSSQLIAYIVAIVLLYVSYYFTGALNVSTACIIPFDTIAVCSASSGIYDAVKSATISANAKQEIRRNNIKAV